MAKAEVKAATNLLIAGYENSGKSTLGATIKDGLIINCDHKTYNFNVPHANYGEWKGLQDFTTFVNAKVKAFKEKFGKLPSIVVIDTITHLALTMKKHYTKEFGKDTFKVYDKLGEETTALGDYFKQLNEWGISVVILAHIEYESQTNRITIPSQGAFKRAGGWISFTNESVFIDRGADYHQVVLKDGGNSSVRTTIPDIMNAKEQEIKVDFNEFNINEHIQKILSNRANTKSLEL